jgi:N-methylhydantoinase A
VAEPAAPPRPGGGRSKRVGIDIGGTFTDVFVFDDETGELRTGKTWSTPDDPSQLVGVFDELGIDLGAVSVFSHAATVGVNAVVTRTGVPTGMLCTRGHRDVLDFGRGLRGIEQLWDLSSLRPHLVRPIVPRVWRRPITERVLYDGSVLVPLDEEEVVREAAWLAAQGVESLAIAFINSYVNPEHERRAKEIVRRELPGLSVSTSTEIFPAFRELYRTTSVAINAYVSPKVDAYLEQLERRLRGRGFEGLFTVMKVDGGFATVDAVRGRGIETMHSGPVAGVSAARFVGEAGARENLLLIDMGGTTADVSVVTDGMPPFTREYEVEQDLFLGIPAIEVQSIGAGGGSIAWIDSGGALRVGPASAGSSPGPACYGRGGDRPTVTDAHVVRGTLSPDHFLGGATKLDVARARAAVETVAARLGLSVEAAAQGIIDIVEVNMVGALRDVTIYQGRDPRDYALFAFGAAGPMHASALGAELGAAEVVIPPWPGEFSAFGLLASDYRVELGRSLVRPLSEIRGDELTGILLELERQALERLVSQGVDPATVAFRRWLDGAYQGQSWDTTCELPRQAFADEDVAACGGRFEDAYEQAWGNRLGMPVRVSALRVTAVGRSQRPALGRLPAGGVRPEDGAVLGEVQATLRDDGVPGRRRLPVYDRDRLRAGNRIEGPALVVQRSSTTVLHAADRALVDEIGNIVIEVEAR